MRRLRLPVLLAVLAGSAAGCAPLGGLGDVLGTGSSSLYGEVRSVDTRRGRIQVREQRGRDYTVRYDNRTRVTYRDRQYPVSSLERGDEVQMRLEYDRNNQAWAEQIELRSSARTDRDRDRGSVWSGRVERLDGRVQQVDPRRGYFTMSRDRGGALVVYMPRDARRDDIRRLDRLRRGERVRVEVRSHGRDQAELVRFR